MAIPKVLEMVEPGSPKDFYDAMNSTNYPGTVQVSLISSDSTNNYYRFSASGVEVSIIRTAFLIRSQ